jgi:CubicO group peptidase (beta-lactamase class C family)
MTVRDLVKWNDALHRTTRLLRASTYQQMITPDALNDGYRVRYAKGLSLTAMAGHPSLQHGGGINGWTTHNAYFPAESLSIVVLYNTSGPSGPAEATEAIARAVLGSVLPKAVALTGDPSRYAGTYAGRGRGGPQQVAIEVNNGIVQAVRGGQKRDLVHIGNDTFVQGATRFVFGTREGAATLRIDGGSANNVLKRR